jgi:hypothetical protein
LAIALEPFLGCTGSIESKGRFEMMLGTIQQDYRHLREIGFSEREASALAALAHGVNRRDEGSPPHRLAWRYEELVRLEFLRFLVESGRLADGPGSMPSDIAEPLTP